jgi:hypothetical protein
MRNHTPFTDIKRLHRCCQTCDRRQCRSAGFHFPGCAANLLFGVVSFRDAVPAFPVRSEKHRPAGDSTPKWTSYRVLGQSCSPHWIAIACVFVRGNRWTITGFDQTSQRSVEALDLIASGQAGCVCIILQRCPPARLPPSFLPTHQSGLAFRPAVLVSSLGPVIRRGGETCSSTQAPLLAGRVSRHSPPFPALLTSDKKATLVDLETIPVDTFHVTDNRRGGVIWKRESP